MQLFFAPKEIVLDQNLMSNSIKLENAHYNHEYGMCILPCVHGHKHSDSISVPGIIRSGLCFTYQLIISSLDTDDSKATILNSLEKALAEDTNLLKESRSNH